VDTVTFEGQSVKFEAKKFGFTYEGTLNDKGDEINGTFNQGPAKLPLILKRVAQLPNSNRPQHPQKPYPYKEEQVTYKNEKDNVKLAGTLTLPTSGGTFPAVILISGSGAQDRDESIGGHRPFLVLADHLTRNGIAVLRVDDRGIGGSDLGNPSATSENFAEDVLAGIQFLKTRKEINPKHIGLIGHSEGGIIAPMVAARSNDVAFIVLLAGLGQLGEDVIYTQTELIQKAQGLDPETIAQAIALQKKIHAIVKNESDGKRIEQLVSEEVTRFVGAMNETQRKAFRPVAANIKGLMPMY
jgi:pimeloyl-ACP methyl ester carboxylesterase